MHNILSGLGIKARRALANPSFRGCWIWFVCLDSWSCLPFPGLCGQGSCAPILYLKRFVWLGAIRHWPKLETSAGLVEWATDVKGKTCQCAFFASLFGASDVRRGHSRAVEPFLLESKSSDWEMWNNVKYVYGRVSLSSIPNCMEMFHAKFSLNFVLFLFFF